MHPNCAAVNEILQAAGVTGRVRLLDEAVTTARAAAEQLGCPVGAIANSFYQLRRASPAFVREHTHQPIGGVAPVGHPRPIPTIVDRALAEFDELWAAGGIPQAVFPLTYDELLRLTGGAEADVG